MKICIKNMNCPACIYFVKSELERHEISFKSVELGEIELSDPISIEQMNTLKIALQKYGLEIVDKVKLVKKVKAAIQELISNPEFESKIKLFEFVRNEVNEDYNFLNELFIKEEDTTIEKYYMARKVERAIELLMHYNLNLTEITYQLNFNSVTHFSNQFRTFTGMSPLRYKEGTNVNSVYFRRFTKLN
jgi:AraC-like DNA-binding protein